MFLWAWRWKKTSTYSTTTVPSTSAPTVARSELLQARCRWFFNAEPTTSYQVVNAGTMGGSGGGPLGGGTFTDATPRASLASYALAYGGADTPLLEQIDGFPAGYTLPVGQEARLSVAPRRACGAYSDARHC